MARTAPAPPIKTSLWVGFSAAGAILVEAATEAEVRDAIAHALGFAHKRYLVAPDRLTVRPAGEDDVDRMRASGKKPIKAADVVPKDRTRRGKR